MATCHGTLICSCQEVHGMTSWMGVAGSIVDSENTPPPHTHTLLRIHLMPKPWSFSYQNLHLFMNDSNAKWFWVMENGVCLVFSFASLNRLFWGGWTYHRYLRTTSMLGWLVGFSIFFKKSPYLLFSWWVHSKCLIIVGGLYTSLYTQIPNSWPHSVWENCFDSRCLYIH